MLLLADFNVSYFIKSDIGMMLRQHIGDLVALVVLLSALEKKVLSFEQVDLL